MLYSDVKHILEFASNLACLVFNVALVWPFNSSWMLLSASGLFSVN